MPSLFDREAGETEWKVCGYCGREFEIASNARQRLRKYCSPACGTEANRLMSLARYQRLNDFRTYFNDEAPTDDE